VDELENPYRPGAGTPPPALRGRDALIAGFTVTTRRAGAGRPGKSVMPIGLRGVGKTVLLNRFCEIAELEGFKVGFVEALESGEVRRLLAVRLRAILLDLDRGPVATAARRALQVLKSFTYQLPDGSSVTLDVDALAGAADSGDLASDVTDLLVATGEAARARSTGVLLAIDEVQYLAAEDLGALITAIHRTNQLNLPVVLTGAGLPRLPGLAGEARSYAERLFEFPVVGSLSRADARDAIAIPAREAGVKIESAALELIAKRSHGYPYFLQEWAYHVWNHAPASPIRARDVTAAAPHVVRHLDESFFLIRYDRLTPREREYLQAMARLGPGPHRSGDIAAALGVSRS